VEAGAGGGRALADYLGHADPGFTLRTYTHLMPASSDRARQAIGAAFSREPGVSQDAKTQRRRSATYGLKCRRTGRRASRRLASSGNATSELRKRPSRVPVVAPSRPVASRPRVAPTWPRGTVACAVRESRQGADLAGPSEEGDRQRRAGSPVRIS
jgi:hypothetical protein